MNKPLEYGRLQWAAKRGMLELDLVLGPYVAQYPQLSYDDQVQFCQFLESEDQDLFGWLLQAKEPPCEFKLIVKQVLEIKKQSF